MIVQTATANLETVTVNGVKRPVAWKPHEGPQEEALTRVEYEVLFGGTRGPGKTSAGMAWLTLPFVDFKHVVGSYRALVLRKNADDLSDWLDRSRRFFAPLGGRVVGRPAVIRFPSGAIFRTGHLSDANAYNKYIGHEYQRVLIEELTQIPKEDLYLKVISCCRSTNVIFPQVFSTTNPGNVGHAWVKRRWQIEGKPPYPLNVVFDPITGRDRIFIHGTIHDNPTLMKNDPRYIDFLNSLPEPLRSAWRDGDWSVFAGQYFMLSNIVHGIDPFEIPSNWEVWGAMDYGEQNPCSFGLYCRDEISGGVYRIAEYYSPGFASQHAKAIHSTIESCKWVDVRPENIEIKAPPDVWTKRKLDQARVQSAADVFKEHGLKLRRVSDDRIHGWRLCKEYLHFDMDEQGNIVLQPKFRYFRGECPNFEENIPNQIHSKTNVEDLEKNDTDHTADEFRYSLVGAERKKFNFDWPIRLRGV
jgi:hypothetical protein